jgi:hypothetical protein
MCDELGASKRVQTLVKEFLHSCYVVMGSIEVIPFLLPNELLSVLGSVLFRVLVLYPYLDISSAIVMGL